jgi:hypothetical protein
VPRCLFCGDPITDRKRARLRRNTTCSKEHADALKEWRQWVFSQKKCLACWTPSSPAERADFRAWRRARGERGEKPGAKKGSKRAKPVDTWAPEAPAPVESESRDAGTSGT